MDGEKKCCICHAVITNTNIDICDEGWICKTCKRKCPVNCLPCPVEMEELKQHGEEF